MDKYLNELLSIHGYKESFVIRLSSGCIYDIVFNVDKSRLIKLIYNNEFIKADFESKINLTIESIRYFHHKIKITIIPNNYLNLLCKDLMLEILTYLDEDTSDHIIRNYITNYPKKITQTKLSLFQRRIDTKLFTTFIQLGLNNSTLPEFVKLEELLNTNISASCLLSFKITLGEYINISNKINYGLLSEYTQIKEYNLFALYCCYKIYPNFIKKGLELFNFEEMKQLAKATICISYRILIGYMSISMDEYIHRSINSTRDLIIFYLDNGYSVTEKKIDNLFVIHIGDSSKKYFYYMLLIDKTLNYENIYIKLDMIKDLDYALLNKYIKSLDSIDLDNLIKFGEKYRDYKYLIDDMKVMGGIATL